MTWRLKLPARAATLAVLGALCLAAGFVGVSVKSTAVGRAPVLQTGPGRLTLEAARAFEDFPLFWLGARFKGRKLRAIVRRLAPGATNSSGEVIYNGINAVIFVYGTCTISGEGGCPPPVQVHVMPGCLKAPGAFDTAAAPSSPRVVADGALAQEMGDGHLRLWSGDVHLAVFDLTVDTVDVDAVLSALVPLNASARAFGGAWAAPAQPGRECPESLMPTPAVVP